MFEIHNNIVYYVYIDNTEHTYKGDTTMETNNLQQLSLSNKSVFGFIKSYLDVKAVNSKNTAKGYEKDIRQFFKTTRGKEIESLTVDDLIFTNQEVEEYKLNISHMYATSSVERKIASVKNLYSKLEANDYNVKEAWFNVEKLKGECNSWDVVEWSDVQKMIEIALTEDKGDIKSALLETAVVTSFRRTSLLNLKWEHLINKDGVWVLCAVNEAVGKNKKNSYKAINNDLAERLFELRDKYKHEKIFPLQQRTVTVMMQRYRQKLNLGDNVTFHSLKKCGINEVYEITGGDIMAVAEQGDHKSFGTTMKHYMSKKKKFSQMCSLKIGREIDLSPLKDLSHEDLLSLVLSASRSTQIELINKIEKR